MSLISVDTVVVVLFRVDANPGGPVASTEQLSGCFPRSAAGSLADLHDVGRICSAGHFRSVCSATMQS
eukprot:4404249-Amphidinium_carterae.1